MGELSCARATRHGEGSPLSPRCNGESPSKTCLTALELGGDSTRARAPSRSTGTSRSRARVTAPGSRLVIAPTDTNAGGTRRGVLRCLAGVQLCNEPRPHLTLYCSTDRSVPSYRSGHIENASSLHLVRRWRGHPDLDCHALIVTNSRRDSFNISLKRGGLRSSGHRHKLLQRRGAAPRGFENRLLGRTRSGTPERVTGA